MELIKALINVVVFVNIASAVRAAGMSLGYINVWGDYQWTGPAPLGDRTEWLRKPAYEEIVSGQTLRGYDEDLDDMVEYDDVIGYAEHDTAVIDSLDGFQVIAIEPDEAEDIFERPYRESVEGELAERTRYTDGDWMTARLEGPDYDDREARWGLRS